MSNKIEKHTFFNETHAKNLSARLFDFKINPSIQNDWNEFVSMQSISLEISIHVDHFFNIVNTAWFDIVNRVEFYDGEKIIAKVSGGNQVGPVWPGKFSTHVHKEGSICKILYEIPMPFGNQGWQIDKENRVQFLMNFLANEVPIEKISLIGTIQLSEKPLKVVLESTGPILFTGKGPNRVSMKDFYNDNSKIKEFVLASDKPLKDVKFTTSTTDDRCFLAEFKMPLTEAYRAAGQYFYSLPVFLLSRSEFTKGRENQITFSLEDNSKAYVEAIAVVQSANNTQDSVLQSAQEENKKLKENMQTVRESYLKMINAIEFSVF